MVAAKGSPQLSDRILATKTRQWQFVLVAFSSFISMSRCGVLPTLRLTTTFPLSDCNAFAGSRKQATVRAFCITINQRASFPDDTVCDVEASSCTTTIQRRSLLQATNSSALIVQQGSFNGDTAQEVDTSAQQAVSNVTEFQSDLVQTLNDFGDESIADQIMNTTFAAATVTAENDPPPVPNQCQNNLDCDEYQLGDSTFCLNTTTPFICVQCLNTADCDSGEECSSLNKCQATQI